MKRKEIGLLITLICVNTTMAFANDQIISEEKTVPAPEGPLTVEKIPPLFTTESVKAAPPQNNSQKMIPVPLQSEPAVQVQTNQPVPAQSIPALPASPGITQPSQTIVPVPPSPAQPATTVTVQPNTGQSATTVTVQPQVAAPDQSTSVTVQPPGPTPQTGQLWPFNRNLNQVDY